MNVGREPESCVANVVGYRNELQTGDWLGFRRCCETSCLSQRLPLDNRTSHDLRRTTLENGWGIDLGLAGRTGGIQRLWRLGLVLAMATQALAQPKYAAIDLGLGTANAINASGQVVGKLPTASGFHAFLYSGGAMIDLGTLGGNQSDARGVNASGQVVGWSTLSPGDSSTYHAFLYSGGVMMDLGTLGGVNSVANGINDSGQVVGWSQTSQTFNGETHAFVYGSGTMFDLGAPGGNDWSYQSVANCINAGGDVAGYFMNQYADIHPFLFANSSIIDLGTLAGASSARARAINAGGQVVGSSGHAFLYSGGTMIDLGTLGGSDSEATGINAGGQVVGWSYISAAVPIVPHVFLYSGGTMTDVNSLVTLPPGVVVGGMDLALTDETGTTGINDNGQIAANGTDGHVYLLTPNGSVAAPILTAPANLASGVSLTPALTWNAASGATSYDVYLGTTNPPSFAANRTATSYSPGTLTAGTIYYWQVVAKNGTATAGSAIWSFMTQPPAPAAPALTSPANGATGVAVAPTLTWSASTLATSYDVYFGTAAAPPLVTNTAAKSYAPGTLSPNATYHWQIAARNSSGATGSAIWSFTTQASAPSAGAWFVPVTPCRVADTRNAAGTFGGPTLGAGSARSFPIPQGGCGIPATAQAYSLNVTAVPQGPLGFLTLWPTGQPQANVSTLNSWGGIVVANAAIVPAGSGGAVSVFASNTTDVILDINGYFGASDGYALYPTTPCRIADTRWPTGQFGGPSLFGGQTRDFPIPFSSCGVTDYATAYSLNVTAVPHTNYLGFLTIGPTGSQPNVSTLNSWTGKVVANAAIVPADINESVSVFVTDATDAILDINGYFGLSEDVNALSFHPVTPCRVADTRNPNGAFGGPKMTAGTTRSFAIPASGCSAPATAKAYSVNVTVVPDGRLSFLSAWPAGSPQPNVSTLNSWDGSVVANAAIVPAGTNGAISIYVTDPTQVILDINGYFAP